MSRDFDDTPDADPADTPEAVGRRRPEHRALIGALILWSAAALVLGVTNRSRALLEANDISRWCTVWSLVERGTYAIDRAPWLDRTMDRVRRPDKVTPPGPDARRLDRLSYAVAPPWWKRGEPTVHDYSSKPPLLPTLAAGLLYPFRLASGVPLEAAREVERHALNVTEPVPGQPGQFTTRLATGEERTQQLGPVKFPAHVYYFKPIILLFNAVPFVAMLVLLARLLDRHAANDWAWMYSLTAAGFGTYLTSFNQTLNNHTVAATSAFFALYALVRVFDDGQRAPRYFAAAGFWAAFCAANELPAALFGALLFLCFVVRFPRSTLLYFVPAAAVPIAAFLVTQVLATGQLTPIYEEFGTKSYNFEGSYWNTPLAFDYFNVEPEPKPLYLFHMTLGHHGVFSLSPIFLFALLGTFKNLFGGARRMPAAAWLTLLLTVAMLAFYTWNPKARNYGGSTQGLRWLFWLIPFWLIMLPGGVEAGQRSRAFRTLTLIALGVSIFSVGYALRSPWTNPWITEFLEYAGWYPLRH